MIKNASLVRITTERRINEQLSVTTTSHRGRRLVSSLKNSLSNKQGTSPLLASMREHEQYDGHC